MAAGTAWEIYDGVVYRMLKKRLGPQDHWPAGLDVLIVSAKYGVIRPSRRIETYDQAMPPDGQPGRWAGRLGRLVAARDYRFVHVNLGRAYRAQWTAWLRSSTMQWVKASSGRTGKARMPYLDASSRLDWQVCVP
jgi:hypothetical protein